MYGSEKGYTLRNSKMLARSVSLFWIGVALIAHLLDACKAQTAFAFEVLRFRIVWANEGE
jgi:hypothetical protein